MIAIFIPSAFPLSTLIIIPSAPDLSWITLSGEISPRACLSVRVAPAIIVVVIVITVLIVVRR
jgi:hypothetical protein